VSAKLYGGTALSLKTVERVKSFETMLTLIVFIYLLNRWRDFFMNLSSNFFAKSESNGFCNYVHACQGIIGWSVDRLP
jgi:hypothetical protein